ncbi:MAG TPA: aromatic ring-hydroxylating dioxygenase subunit alpha [Stellaceae bacterium]|nr:aromatic ring-hydroxylating dioxygenase subunit alpha [Stellaceae bacterium]
MTRDELIAEIRKLLALIDAGTTDLTEETMRVPIAPYLDRATFDREVEHLFRQRPQFVGFSSRFRNPGDYCALEVAGVPILVIRGEDRRIRAFLNFCRHRGAQLKSPGDGCVEKAFRCPYHGWRYSTDGTLLTVPYGEQGFPGLDKSRSGLIPLPAGERFGLVFVTPQPGGTCDIDDMFGDVGADLETWNFSDRYYVETRTYEVAANWKLNLDTFGESYHFGMVHPTTFALKTFENILTRKSFRYANRLCHPALALREMRLKPEAEWDLSFAMSVVYYLFPSTILFLVRGHMETFTILPGPEPGTSINRHQIYLLGPEPPASAEERQQISALFEQVTHVLNNEDYPIVQSMQRVFSGCGDQSLLFGRNEPGLHFWHRLIDEEMAGI